MSVKTTVSELVNKLDDDASWADVKSTFMAEYKKHTGDARADAFAAVGLCAIFVTVCIVWISSQ